MTKISNTATFASASNPALERIGNVLGKALGKVVQSAESLVEGMHALSQDKETFATPLLAKASKVLTKFIAGMDKMPFATSDLEAPPEKPSAKSSFGKGMREGYAATREATPEKPKPGLTGPKMA